jgi:electron-transferring-flavoprotein dehydrogenase
LIGCSAGFLNSVKIKGTHTAMKSGMLAAEALYPLLTAKGEENTVLTTQAINEGDSPIEATAYEPGKKTIRLFLFQMCFYFGFLLALYNSWVGKELKEVRNAHSSFHSPLGTVGGMTHTAFSCFISRGNEPWTLKNTVLDANKTKPANSCQKIDYPKPDGKLSFDLLTNLQRSGMYFLFSVVLSDCVLCFCVCLSSFFLLLAIFKEHHMIMINHHILK